MDASKDAYRPKCDGYVGRKNKRTYHRKRRSEPRYYTMRRVQSPRRIYAERKRRRKDT